MSIFDEIAKRIGGGATDGSPSLGPLTRVEDQSPDERKLWGWIKEKLETIRQANSRIQMEGTYLTNTAYLLGYNGVMFDPIQRQFKNSDPKRRVSKVRQNINKILPTVQNKQARLTKIPPKWEVKPNSDSTHDKDSARLGIQIIEDVTDKNHFQEKRQDKCMLAMQGGVSYIQVTLDPTLGKPLIDPVTEEQTGYEGEVRLEVLNCLEVFPDPLAKTIEDAQHLIKAKVRKLEYFREKWPERGQAVKEEDNWLISSLYDLKTNSLGSNGGTSGNAQNKVQNTAIEIVYYEKRSTEHPNGRMVVCANGIILEDKDMPVGEYDIVKFDDIIIGGRYQSEATITHLRPLQDRRNTINDKTNDWIKYMLAGKYLVAKGSGLGQESLNNEGGGEVVTFNPVPNAPPPSVMPIPQIPQYVYKEIEVIDSTFDFISGINEVSRGELPSSSIPASGMAFLQEQDETRLSTITSRNEEGYARLGSLILRYVGKYYQVPRIIKIAGEGLGYTVKEFVGSDLNDNFDVTVIPGSTVPFSKALKRQDIMNAYQSGILGDPADPKLRAKVLKMMEFGDVAEMWQDQAIDQNNIKKAIEILEDGGSPPYHELDNHMLYIDDLNRYRKGEKFQTLPPPIQQNILQFLETHIQGEIRLRNPQIPDQQMMAEKMMEKTNQMAQIGPEGMPPAPPQIPQALPDQGAEI